MRIAFIWDWPRASEIFPNWRDGLRAALELIEKDHQVDWYLDGQYPYTGYQYDFILLWGDSTLPFFHQIEKYDCRKGICLSTMPTDFNNLRKLEVVYAESTPVYEAVRREGIRCIKAFGTDTEFFKPNTKVVKDIPYFYPATFSPWKKQSDIAYLGDQLLCLGTIQPDGTAEYEAVKAAGCKVKVGYFSPTTVRNYYTRAQNVIIPAVHGSERTVLESMSMNILPLVTNSDNTKTRSYLEEFTKEVPYLDPRDFIEKYYSAPVYAKALVKGML
jgi:hypothetical protein